MGMEPQLVQYNSRPALEENQGTVTEEEAAFLYGLAIALRPRCIAEIGTGWMRSLRAFCEAKRWLWEHLNWNCRVFSCDIKPDIANRASRDYPDAHVLCCDRLLLAKEIHPAPELIFIDGDHKSRAVQRDYEAMDKVAEPGAVFVFHDSSLIPDVAEAAAELGACTLPTARGMGILIKPPKG